MNSISNRCWYSDTIKDFLSRNSNEILGRLVSNNYFSLETSQRNAWEEEIEILKDTLAQYDGQIYYEFSVPRMGQRIDVVLLIQSVIFVLEFKVGEEDFKSYDIDQVVDYALDLKNFHETSHSLYIAPILIATKAKTSHSVVGFTPYDDKLLTPIRTSTDLLPQVISSVLKFSEDLKIDPQLWEKGRYHPSPNIVEAAMALYSGHNVAEISRSDASAINLTQTTDCVSEIIERSKSQNEKSICFVTGVPGAGKTLIGLNIATEHIDKESELYAVFLSGNGPLVAILREALARDKVHRAKSERKKIRKGDVAREVKMFIQNIHNFRDDRIADKDRPPIEHVAIFDEAQRAWNIEQTSSFMKRKKNIRDFSQSEPEFLISSMDRHKDWAVIVCLVGGGQEINTGEAGIGAWIEALNKSFPQWKIYVSPNLTDSEYNAQGLLERNKQNEKVEYKDELHLIVSMRSFRAEHVSLFVKNLLDRNLSEAKGVLTQVIGKYPIVLTRDVQKAREWLKSHARGSERYGIIVSSQAERLKPHSIFVKSPVDPVHWFLEGKNDTRSSYYLEDVATEFHVQGLELDWACVTWDADLRYSKKGWSHWSFRGDKWYHIIKAERQRYLINAYRVLLTRARQGMVIVVPAGDKDDHTRPPEFYDETFQYLLDIGIKEI
ncbi:MAG TPA: DUF2075 domain-containing protein [Acidobacteriota bacterium]|nr:DUF2075 domain-containing protein [Acidobacteriota bacterium]HNT18311.1 DUF2075 domain-containing protein [Acidobacteriota bacterium]